MERQNEVKMILHLSNSVSRGLVLVAAIVVGFWLSYFGIRAAFARHDADSNSAQRAELAVRRESGNPEYWYLLGRYQESNLENPDSSLARKSFREAIALNPLATDAWLDLGILEEADGKTAEARTAYLQAKKSYPTSAQVHWAYGNFLLRQGERADAYAELRQAIEADPALATQGFTRVFRTDPNIDEILAEVLPPQQSVYVDVITELVNEKQLAVAKTVWSRLMTLHPRLEIRDVDRFVSQLGLSGELLEARRVWDQAMATMNLPLLCEQQGSVIWDPSFESNINGYSFSWRFQPITQGVSIILDKSEKRSGNQSLHLGFDGKHNPNLEAACTIGAVQPSARYHFSGWVKTKAITTDNGIAFRLSSVEDRQLPAVTSRDVHGTNPWTLVEETWNSGPHTRTVQVCIIREASDNPEVRIFGQAWVDDVNLTLLPFMHPTK